MDDGTSQPATAKRHQNTYMKTFTKIHWKMFTVKSRVENKPETNIFFQELQNNDENFQ